MVLCHAWFLASKRILGLNMKFFQVAKFSHREDYGHDYYAQFLTIKNWSLLQVSVSWNDHPGWPYIQVTSGQARVFSLLFWAYKFGLDIDILSRTWRWDYRDDVDSASHVA